jgi:predicted O-linked N-acetylglucosamine transferase (SPINDLY family)
MSDQIARETLRKALSFHQRGQLDKAAKLYRELTRKDPHNFYALHYLGIVEATRGNYAQAKGYLDQSLLQQPQNLEFVQNYATIAFQAEQYESALEIAERGLRLNQRDVPLLYVSALSLWRMERREESIAQFDKLLLLAPSHLAAINERGSVLAELRRYDEAAASFEKVLSYQPQYAEAHLNRGNVLGALKNYDAALAAYDKALAIKPDLADAWLGRGNVLRELKRYSDALATYDRALSLKADLAGAWLGRGNLFSVLERYEDARTAFDRALLLRPDLAEAWVGIGNQCNDLDQLEDASEAFDRALALKPDLAEAWLGRGNVFSKFRRYDDAFVAFDKALRLDPSIKFAAGFRLLAKLHMCDWTDLVAETEQLLSAIRGDKPSSVPFALLTTPASAADQLQCARNFVRDQPALPPISSGEVYSHDRIRVAYLSSELREHAVGYAMVGLFEHHDNSRFEVTGISFEPLGESDFCRRLKGAFENFIDASAQSDEQIAELVRQREIDIVVDLNGHTRNARWGIFARKPAPIQVNYLGYAGTSGAEYFDYIMSDAVIIPKEHFQHYSESVVWLPDSFLVNDDTRYIAERTPERSELDLPEKAFVFCCFNQLHKIDPTIFDIWMHLLREVARSVLWLKQEDALACNNLRAEAERRGVSPERLIFASYLPDMADHLARHRQADLFLDTLHYNAHTTASDALWVGLPVVTYLGSTFAGRVAASQLKAVGLDELIATSLADYEASALRLARDSSLLASVKQKLAGNRSRYPLFDTSRSTRHIEAGYVQMWDRYRRGEKPQSFAVDRTR